jgi:hypothetical protein
MATVTYNKTRLAVLNRRRAARLLRLVLVGVAVAAVVVTTATADSPRCTGGVSSVGPVTLRGGHLSGDTTPHTQACLP